MHFPPSLDHVFQLDPSKRRGTTTSDALEQLANSLALHIVGMARIKNLLTTGQGRTRQGGKDKPITQQSVDQPANIDNNSERSSSAKSNSSRGTLSTPSNARDGPARQAGRALQSVELRNCWSITGQLFVSERQEDKLSITLNTNHALYRSFIDEVKNDFS